MDLNDDIKLNDYCVNNDDIRAVEPMLGTEFKPLYSVGVNVSGNALSSSAYKAYGFCPSGLLHPLGYVGDRHMLPGAACCGPSYIQLYDTLRHYDFPNCMGAKSWVSC